MIEYKHGDILREDAEALVNTVNCVGVMGVALRFNSRTPFQRTSKPTPKRAAEKRFSLVGCLCFKPGR